MSEQSRTLLMLTVALIAIRSWPSGLSRMRPFELTASAKCFRPMKTMARQHGQTFRRNSHLPRPRLRLQFAAILEFRSSAVFRQHDLFQVISRIRRRLRALGYNAVNDSGKRFGVPVPARLPPFLNSLVGEKIAHGSINLIP